MDLSLISAAVNLDRALGHQAAGEGD